MACQTHNNTHKHNINKPINITQMLKGKKQFAYTGLYYNYTCSLLSVIANLYLLIHISNTYN